MFFSYDPAPYLDSDLCRAFHENIGNGDIDGILELLKMEPLLIHARNQDRATSLMIATVHSDTHQALRMVELLMEQGARLGSHDCCRRNTLQYACRYGADLALVETLLQWNDRKGGQKFHWHDRDIYGDSALMLASRMANTPVTMQLLNEIDIVKFAKQNHPFKVLKRAIKSDNERHAMEVAMHDKIRASIKNPEVTRFKGSGKPELSWTLSKCTEAAVDRGMIDLVQVLNQLNRRKVSRALWYTIHDLSEHGVDVSTSVPRVLLRMGRFFTDAWRWKQVRDISLARYGRKEGGGKEGGVCLFGRLPDDVFHRVVAFVVPSAFQHPSCFESQWCGCGNISALGECRWHDCYRVDRTDYDRLYNYSGRD